MAIRFYLPVDDVAATPEARSIALKSLAGKRVLFLSNYRSRNDEIEDVLREALVTRHEAKSLTRMKVEHGRPEPAQKLLPLAKEYDAVIGVFGG